MPEREFIIRALHEYEHRVMAETADEAAQMMNEGEAGRGECVGYEIEAVVSADKAKSFWDGEDERKMCASCGHLLVDGHTGSRDRTDCIIEKKKPGVNPHPTSCDSYRCDCKVAIDPTPEEEDEDV